MLISLIVSQDMEKEQCNLGLWFLVLVNFPVLVANLSGGLHACTFYVFVHKVMRKESSLLDLNKSLEYCSN